MIPTSTHAHAHTCALTHRDPHAHAHTCALTHTHARTHACTHAYVHARTHARTCTHVHARMHTHSRMHTHTRTPTHLHAHAHTCALTHTRAHKACTHASAHAHTHTRARGPTVLGPSGFTVLTGTSNGACVLAPRAARCAPRLARCLALTKFSATSCAEDNVVRCALVLDAGCAVALAACFVFSRFLALRDGTSWGACWGSGVEGGGIGMICVCSYGACLLPNGRTHLAACNSLK